MHERPGGGRGGIRAAHTSAEGGVRSFTGGIPLRPTVETPIREFFVPPTGQFARLRLGSP